jgi:membrane-bound ClpP family serine protease
MSVGVIYFLCFGAGLFYAIVVGLSGHLFGGDVDHHMDVGTDLPVSPLSPTVISTFLTGFGGGGMLANSYFHLAPAPGVLVALLVGALLSGGTFTAISFLFRSTQGGSEFALSDMVGSVVQVVTPIPENGTGEIALIAKGTRVNSPARSVDGSAIARNTPVKIERALGNVFYVRVAQ